MAEETILNPVERLRQLAKNYAAAIKSDALKITSEKSAGEGLKHPKHLLFLAMPRELLFRAMLEPVAPQDSQPDENTRLKGILIDRFREACVALNLLKDETVIRREIEEQGADGKRTALDDLKIPEDVDRLPKTMDDLRDAWLYAAGHLALILGETLESWHDQSPEGCVQVLREYDAQCASGMSAISEWMAQVSEQLRDRNRNLNRSLISSLSVDDILNAGGLPEIQRRIGSRDIEKAKTVLGNILVNKEGYPQGAWQKYLAFLDNSNDAKRQTVPTRYHFITQFYPDWEKNKKAQSEGDTPTSTNPATPQEVPSYSPEQQAAAMGSGGMGS
jgi:hypothetical protein